MHLLFIYKYFIYFTNVNTLIIFFLFFHYAIYFCCRTDTFSLTLASLSSFRVTDIMLKYKKLQASERLQNQQETAGLVPHLAPDVTVVAPPAPAPLRVATGHASSQSQSAPAGSSFAASHHLPTPHRNDAAAAALPLNLAAMVAKAVQAAVQEALAKNNK